MTLTLHNSSATESVQDQRKEGLT